MPTARTQPATRWHPPTPQATASDPLPGPLVPGLDPLLDQLLRARGIDDADGAQRFLNPKLTHLHDPATLPGCVRAAQRLKRAVDEHQPIVIYGDYDVDGITASAILYHTLKQAGASVSTYVPHRLDEGYGLNSEAIRAIANSGSRMAEGQDIQTKESETIGNPKSEIQNRSPLLVSVDCGITANEPAQIAKDLGLDLIITDHHEFDPDHLPDAYALVHPGLPISDGGSRIADLHRHPTDQPQSIRNPKSKIQNHTYPNRDLCGAGVAYKLAWQFALRHTGCEQGGKLPDAYRRLLLDLLAFAALGTVADVMPLTGENRVITKFGLERISHTFNPGLNALIDASNLRSEKIDSYHIGFVLGPRLNACGRMGHAKEAVELLTVATGERAKELAEYLHDVNDERKATERQITAQATQMVLDLGYDDDQSRAIVLAHEDWHPGVVGIVASRLVERFCRPVVILCIDAATGTAKGSARSVNAVNLHAAIQACDAHLTTFGGHAMAAGLSLPADHIDAFRRALVEEVNSRLGVDDLVQDLRIDADVALESCSVRVFGLVKSLAPFGRGNPKPRLMIRRLTLDRPAQRMGSAGKHLSMLLRSGTRTIRAVAWNMGDRADDLPAGCAVDVVFQPAINEWRGNTSAELHVIDVRPAR
ncbi:MAG: single-stranded-DNA-specific exonuclease RecJ [Phycisphaeraceae bacterium]